MPSVAPFTAYVNWPSATLTDRLVRNALAQLEPPPEIVTSFPADDKISNLLQWSAYDVTNHEIALLRPTPTAKVLTCTYTIRKALIRKHFLSRCTHHYVVKNPNAVLKNAVPRTWEIEISFLDELEEMWTDDLWDLGEILDKAETWMILKPGMADRGMGIRLFHTKEELESIFAEFEDEEEDEEKDEEFELERSGGRPDTSVTTSQLRHFVIQEYLANPLLLDPAEVSLPGDAPKGHANLQGHKFHLRVYCVASGALTVYMYTRILALFSASAYTSPFAFLGGSDGLQEDLSAHLTNTSLQTDKGEAGVRLLDELAGCHILSKRGATSRNSRQEESSGSTFTEADIADLKEQVADILADTFRAALGMSVHFQPTPNAFELFGIDFLVSHSPEANPHESQTQKFQVSLLEVNSEPAIELTGPRLMWILEDLFSGIGKVCVAPFFGSENEKAAEADEKWEVGQTKENFRKCLDMQLRGADAWA